MSDEIINKVANSGLITIDLKDFYSPGERVLLDIKPWLYNELVLKEKDFRDYLSQHNWDQYKDKFVAVCCSSEAIIPTWAYMLVAINLQDVANKIVFGNLENLETVLIDEAISRVDFSVFKDARVVIKGCGEINIPNHAFLLISAKLKPIVKSMMYGEPCSTVPLYKRKK